MSLNIFGDIVQKAFSGNLTLTGKIAASLSIIWIILIGYLTWWNSINSSMDDKSFRWEEWLWFGVIPALVPYLFYFIWKKNK